MAKATKYVKLANYMVPAISSSGVAKVTHFKNHQVPLLYPALPECLNQFS
jgi:hypothetical protein